MQRREVLAVWRVHDHDAHVEAEVPMSPFHRAGRAPVKVDLGVFFPDSLLHMIAQLAHCFENLVVYCWGEIPERTYLAKALWQLWWVSKYLVWCRIGIAANGLSFVRKMLSCEYFGQVLHIELVYRRSAVIYIDPERRD